MPYLVEFTDKGARVIKDLSQIEEKKGQPNTLLDPDLSHVRNISPSFWVKVGELVEPMPIEERKAQYERIHSGLEQEEKEALPEFSSDFKKFKEEINALLSGASEAQQARERIIKQEILSQVYEIQEKSKLDLILQGVKLRREIRANKNLCFFCILLMILLKFL
jgi:rRNA maturation protein Rpf1